MEILTKQEGKIPLAIVRVDGDLDLPRSSKLLTSLLELEGKKIYHFLVDLGKVRFISSPALGILISSLQNLGKYGGTIKLIHLNGSVSEKFKITRLIDKFQIFENEEDALRSFNPNDQMFRTAK